MIAKLHTFEELGA